MFDSQPSRRRFRRLLLLLNTFFNLRNYQMEKSAFFAHLLIFNGILHQIWAKSWRKLTQACAKISAKFTAFE